MRLGADGRKNVSSLDRARGSVSAGLAGISPDARSSVSAGESSTSSFARNRDKVSASSSRTRSSVAGKLYIVGTPIGNLGDITKRAQAVLSTVDCIYCEDTRVTRKLLSALQIHAKTERADENILAHVIPTILKKIKAGAQVAFVSDAGMPGISDPGQKLVDAALNGGLEVETVPGPSAAVAALVASGFATEHFFFEGFLPRKDSEKRARLERLASIPGSLIFYESPHRVSKTLQAIAEIFPRRRVALVRELTKMYEETVRETAEELANFYKGKEVKGECVIVMEQAPIAEKPPALSHEDVRERAEELLKQDASISSLAKKLSKETGVSRNEAYVLLLQLQAS